MKSKTIKSAITNEIKRLSTQIKLLESITSTIRATSFELPIPLKAKNIEALLANHAFKDRGVYIISCQNPTDATAIIKQLETYRHGRAKIKENAFLKEAIVKPNGSRSGRSLYVGKIKSMTFRSRLRQHLLGDQNHRTTAIRLIKWLDKSDPKVTSKKLIIRLIPVSEYHLIRALEIAIWNQEKPILGKL